MTFDAALKLSLGFEGGTSDHPADKGGLTQHGITQGVYTRWLRGKGQPDHAVTQISDAEVRAIYFDWYWLPTHCDELPDKLGLCVFDAAVNHGAQRATKLLQKALGVNDDGRFGPATRAAAQTCDEDATVKAYLDAREDFYAEIIERDPTQVAFANGWKNRVDALRDELEGTA